jgi:hypothetical protein
MKRRSYPFPRLPVFLKTLPVNRRRLGVRKVPFLYMHDSPDTFPQIRRFTQGYGPQNRISAEFAIPHFRDQQGYPGQIRLELIPAAVFALSPGKAQFLYRKTVTVQGFHGGLD